MIRRSIQESLENIMGKGKAIIIMGARQVGKSTLLSMLLHDRDDVMWLNGDDIDIQNLWEGMTSTRLRALIGSSKVVVIDEAQRISGIGLRLKLITDQIPDVQVIVTGSSSLLLAQNIRGH